MTKRPKDNHLFGRQLRRWPDAEGQAVGQALARGSVPAFEVWRSRDFLVQLFRDGDHVRITVNRTHSPNGLDWADGITWDELQQIKAEIGRGDAWAVELYPPDEHVIDVANMRHLWLLDEAPAYGWRAPAEEGARA